MREPSTKPLSKTLVTAAQEAQQFVNDTKTTMYDYCWDVACGIASTDNERSNIAYHLFHVLMATNKR